MKKILQILLVIIAAYVFAYVKVGYIKGYKFIPVDFSFFKHKKQSDNNTELQRELNEAIDYYNNGYYSDAIDILEELYYDDDYQTPMVKYMLAKAYYHYDSDYYEDKIKDLFSEVVEETDSLDSAYFYMAKIDYFNDDYNEAYYNIDQFLTYEPESSEGYDWLAWIMYDLTDSPDSALKYEYISIKLDSTNADPYYGIAHFLEKKTDETYDEDTIKLYLTKAVEYGKKSLQLDTSLNSPYYYVAYAYYYLENYDSAVAYFRKYLKRHGSDEDTYYYLAKSFLYLQKSDSTIKYVDTLINDYGDYNDIYYAIRAKAYILKGDYRSASKDFYNAYDADIEGDYAHEYLLLAAKYAEKFDKDIASDYLNEYLDVYEDDFNNKDSVLDVLHTLYFADTTE